MVLCQFRNPSFCVVGACGVSTWLPFWSLGRPLGYLLAPFASLWLILASSLPCLGRSWALFGLIGASLGTNLVHFGSSSTHLGAPWNPRGSILTMFNFRGSILTSNGPYESQFGPNFEQLCLPNRTDCINPDQFYPLKLATLHT